jgi:hypothetical protein
MRNIILQVSNDIDINEIISLLEPLGEAVTFKSASNDGLNENTGWLGKIYMVDNFEPLKREALYDR